MQNLPTKFGRKARVKIRNSGFLTGNSTELIINKDPSQSSENDLQVTSSGSKSLESVIDTGEITIYNLSSDRRKLITQICEDKPTVVLEVGYKGREARPVPLKVLVQADIRHFTHGHNGTDWETTLYFGDGSDLMASTEIEMSFPGPVTTGQVFDKFVKLMKSLKDKDGKKSKVQVFSEIVSYVADEASDLFTPPKLNKLEKQISGKGFSFKGSPDELMAKLSLELGIKLKVQNNMIVPIIRTKPIDGLTIVLIPETGLLGFPQRIEGGGVSFKAMLDPDLIPGCHVTFKPQDPNGMIAKEEVHQVVNIRYSLDNKDGPWVVDAEAKPIKDAIPKLPRNASQTFPTGQTVVI